MSTLLEQASLVLIPSGYKEDVVYSQIPTSGAGDLSFTRASNGTRINSAGLVEVCPWNLLEQSETFDNAVWSKTGVTVTANSVAAPNGTTTADTLVFGASSNEIVQSVGNLIVDQTYTLTIYLRVASGTATMYWGNIDYTTPSITVTTEWQRFTVTQQAAATTRYPKLVSSSGVTVYAWGAQLNIGSTAKPYFPTTDRLNVPRLTYQNGGGGCPSLLLEKQSTNLQYYSQQFDLWSNASDLTVSANATTSPDGTQNADKLNENSSNGYHITGDSNFSSTAGTTYTMSFFAKASERSYARILAPASSYNTDYAYFDLTNGSVSVSSGTASMQSMGNGWYRCVWSLAAVSTSGGIGMWIGPARNMTDAYNTYTGTSGSGIFVYGAQLEASSHATSYIPTTSSSATRVADVYSRSLSNIASGTAYINITDNVALGSVGTHLYGPFSITGASLGLHLSRPNNQRLRLWTQASANVFQTTVTNLKLAITWDGTNVNVYQNGVKVVTNYAYALTNVNNLFSSTSLESSATISEIVLFNSVLTDAECISLTS